MASSQPPPDAQAQAKAEAWAETEPQTESWLLPRPLRPLATAAGFALTALGIAGTVLPLMPGTVFLVAAAWLFARSSPRFEAWLLGLPVVGGMVRDYHAGLGMPLRAKWAACLSIALAVGLSLGRVESVTPKIAAALQTAHTSAFLLLGQAVWALIGVIGVLWITLRVPTKRPRDENSD